MGRVFDLSFKSSCEQKFYFFQKTFILILFNGVEPRHASPKIFTLNSTVSVFFQNIRGMNNKCDDLYTSFLSNNFLPHILYFRECYLLEQNVSFIKMRLTI
jgi:hypothetical protein